MFNTAQRRGLFSVEHFYFVVTIILSLIPVHLSESNSGVGTSNKRDRNAKTLAVCHLIEKNISSASQVFYPFDAGYNKTIYHYASSSTMYSICGVEPGSVADVAKILIIIGQHRVRYAVKGGGHATNPGFSSTTGIQISMRRFRNITYHKNNQTVDLGSGLVWGEVYKTLHPYNIVVVGGRVMDVGVAGYILGGGYSWKSNQYGLSMDTAHEYELVAPDGKVVYVNNQSYPDIFFGLKGGFNNFGIVTNFNMRAVPQTRVYGGILIYNTSQFDAVIQTMADFQSSNKDPKAQIIGSFLSASGQFNLYLLVFYDAPTAPDGTFNSFVSISHIGTLESQSYVSLIALVDSSISVNLRVRYDVVSITNVTTRLLHGIRKRMIHLNKTLGSRSGAFFLCDCEPFISSYLDNSQGGAYPHPASPTPLFPVEFQFSWTSPDDDSDFIAAIKATRKAILKIVLKDGQDVGGSKQILYPNYVIKNTPLPHMYGKNVARLQHIRNKWDPKNVTYLTGGIKF